MSVTENHLSVSKLSSTTKRWISHFCLLTLPITTALATVSIQPAKAQFNGCMGSDCVQYDLSTQAKCLQVGTETSPNAPVGTTPGWYLGLNTEIDQKILKGDVIAYKIRWSSGWSGWYVTGVNDLDAKFNTGNKTMRRIWSYFTDHQHLYIICYQP
ncbi:MAG TPA: hypothetical protein V6D25_07620 [Leptolyngbyaceae cyanobacterium]